MFGAHMSIAGGLYRSIERGRKAGCDAVQIFTKNNNQWSAKPLEDADVRMFMEVQKQTGVKCVAAHTSYLINCASPKDDLWQKSIAALGVEIDRCFRLNIPYLVLHPGAHVGSGVQAGLERIIKAIDIVFKDRPEKGVMLLLENTAGAGSVLGSGFEELGHIIQTSASSNALGVCFDTCHAFAAGYDFRKEAGYKRMMSDIDKSVGLDRIRLFHFNDSKQPAGKRKDRHEHIGKGEIGREGFSRIVRDKRFKDVPKILETPKSDDLHEDIENLSLLRKMLRD